MSFSHLFIQPQSPKSLEKPEENKYNEQSFFEGYNLLDNLKEQSDLDTAIQKLQASPSFNAFYALGELYRDGVIKSVNGNSIRLDQNRSLAAEYFLKAYDFNKSMKVVIRGVDVISPIAYETITLSDVTSLSKSAEKGNAEALFQLASFFEQERISEHRKSSLMTGTLSELENACLMAAANLFHPHAACKLALKTEDPYEKLRYSQIAADPAFAMLLSYKKDSSLIELRGYDRSSEVVELNPPANVLPPSLTVTKAVSTGKMAGIFDNSSCYQTKISKLPATYRPNPSVNPLGQDNANNAVTDREKRMRYYAKMGR